MNLELESIPVPSGILAKSTLVQPDFRRALRGVWLLTLKRALSLRRLPLQVAGLLILPSLALYTVEPTESTPYFMWLLDFYLLLALPLYCLSSFGGMIRDEVQADTLGFLVTRPISRAGLLVAEFLCQMAWVQIVVAGNGALLFAVGIFKQIPQIQTVGLTLFGLQALAVLAYGALSTLLGLLHARYFVLGIVYGLIVEVGIGKIPTNVNSLSLSHHVQTVLATVPPIRDLYTWPAEGSLFSLSMLALATVVFLGLAAVVFTFREFHHSEEMQK